MLEIESDLTLTRGDGRRGSLVASGRDLVLEVDGAAGLEGVAGPRALRSLAKSLAHAGLTLRIVSGGRLIVIAGSGVRAGLLHRALGYSHARIDPQFAARSVLTRLRGRR